MPIKFIESYKIGLKYSTFSEGLTFAYAKFQIYAYFNTHSVGYNQFYVLHIYFTAFYWMLKHYLVSSWKNAIFKLNENSMRKKKSF